MISGSSCCRVLTDCCWREVLSGGVVFCFQAGSGVLLIDRPLLRSIRPLKQCFRNPAYRMVGLGPCWSSSSRGEERADLTLGILKSAWY